MISALIGSGADMRAFDGSGRTALHTASANGHGECVAIIVEYGSEVNSLDGKGDTPLHVAASHGQAQTVHTLVNLGDELEVTDSDGLTPLIRVMLHPIMRPEAHTETALVLISHRENVNTSDERARTSLHLAVHARLAPVVKALIAKGAAVNARVQEEWTPLMDAAWKGEADIICELLAHGADANARSSSGKTALH